MLFDLNLSIHMCLSLHTVWHLYHHSLRNSDFPGFSCPDFRTWSSWILSDADQSGAAKAWIISTTSEALSFQPPAHLSSFLVVTRERHLYCSYMYITYILTFAPIGDVIFLYYCVKSGDNFVIILIC